MATKEFDKNFAHLIEDALHNALEYTGYSLDIDCIYIYISLERSVQYLVFSGLTGACRLSISLMNM